ncbi:MAG: flagellar transcriptional regulator FlhD [Deltaproteobacteria bacterium]|nr:flagellar transcriptional regulator FlhD [Deltaproteobacteria bacterium]MBW2135637.1 flagellar transcriptional regulator FlhD [Deltaproteobacteria bacterium]
MEDWRKTIKCLNLAYLAMVKEIGADSKNQSYVQTAFGLNKDTLKRLLNLDLAEIEQIANAGATLFRLKSNHLEQVRNSCRKGSSERILSLVSAGLLTDNEDVEAKGDSR